VSSLDQLKQEAIALEKDLAQWQYTRCANFNARVAGHISRTQAGSSKPGVGYWPGKVEAYFDLYVAGVWNTSRTARLLLISLILKLSSVTYDADTYAREQKEAQVLVDDIIASIPYHLSDGLPRFLAEGGKGEGLLEPGRPVGGLLLMHPIYVASTLLIVPQEMREYLKDCLSWIGINMGIGQASVFAKVRLPS